MAKASKRLQVVATPRAKGISAGPRVAIYNRVSTGHQDATRAMDDLRATAARRGYDVVLEIAEQGSGKRNDREGLQQILTAARRGDVDVVLCTRLDRMGRSAIDVLTNIRTLADAGVEFVADAQGLHIRPRGDAMSTAMLQLMASFAELEHSLIVERVNEGLGRARKRGKVFGRPRDESVSSARVKALRDDKGLSWSKIAESLDCTVGLARLRYAEAT